NIGVPLDNVHLLVIKLPDNILDPLASQSNTRSHGVYLLIPGVYCKFGPKSRLARNSFYFYRAVADLGHLQLKELHDKLRIRRRKDDLRTMSCILHRLDVAADTLPDLIFLRRHTLAIRQKCFVLAEINGDIRPLEPAHRPTYDISRPV